jgi:hypothetical protein
MSTTVSHHRAACTLALTLLAATPVAWSADVITDWDASAGLPTATTPPWQQTGTAFSLAPGVLTISTSSYADNVYFLQDSSVRPGFSTLAGASIEARLRYVSGSTVGDARDAGFIGITQGNNWGNALFVGNGRIFIGSGTNTRGATASIDTSVFHTYRIDLGASAGGSATFSVAVDGLTVLSGSTYNSTSDNGLAPNFYWGEGSALAYGTTQWQFVRDAAPVPEPATWALWAVGLLAAGTRLRPQRGGCASRS